MRTIFWFTSFIYSHIVFELTATSKAHQITSCDGASSIFGLLYHTDNAMPQSKRWEHNQK